MKYLILWLGAIIILLSSCNHEGPTNVSGYDDFAEIKFSITDNWDYPSLKNYHIYLPAAWCPKSDSIRPWAAYCLNGNKYEDIITNDRIQNPDPGFENYYKITIWANPNDEVNVFLVYGNYKAIDKYTKANINPSSKFAVNYDVTTNKTQEETVLAFRLHKSSVSPINPNIIIPIRADVIAPSNLELNKPSQFWLSNFEFTPAVGIDKISWEFPDGYSRYGWNVTHTLGTRGTARVTIIDNLGKKLILLKDL